MSHPGPLQLGVNIDHVATLRQARGTDYPDPCEAAFVALAGGADFITLHLREDRRHIQPADVQRLRRELPCRMNLEMAITGEMLALATQLRPSDCCLVPEKRQELTTEGGLEVAGQQRLVTDAVARLSDAGIRVSLFVDPEPRQIEAAARTAAPAVELHTGRYANLAGREQQTELERIADAARQAQELGLSVNAGHGLTATNLQPVASLPQIRELNIGHAIVARAVFVGLEAAVGEVVAAMHEAREVAAQ